MELEYLPCPTCRTMTLVEIPPCADEHDRDCPDRACTVCGAGLSVRGQAAFGLVVSLPPLGTPAGPAPTSTTLAAARTTAA